MKKILITGSMVVAFSMFLSSCLKDHSLTLDTSLSNSVTEFANNGAPASLPSNGAAPRFSIDLGALKVGDTTAFNVNVDYAGANMAPQDIKVVVEQDASLLATYNNEHSADGANYVAPPSDMFPANTFPLTITIPKGKQLGQIKIPVKLPADYDFNASYALPLKISSTSTGVISGNFGSALYGLTVRNIYDGEFTVTGTMVDLTNATFHAKYPKTIDLVTLGATSNGYWDINLNGGMFGYLFDANGSGSYFGNFAPIFHFDASGTITSISNYYGNATQNSSHRDAQLDPSGVNKMTFDTNGKPSKVDVSYFMLQSGAIRLKITEHYEYKGSR